MPHQTQIRQNRKLPRNYAASAICRCVVRREMNVPTFYPCGLHDPQLSDFTEAYQAWVRFLFEMLYA